MMGTALGRDYLLLLVPKSLFLTHPYTFLYTHGHTFVLGEFSSLETPPPNISLLLMEAERSAEVGRTDFQFASLSMIHQLFSFTWLWLLSIPGTGELAQLSRALVALAEDQCSVSNTHMVAHNHPFLVSTPSGHQAQMWHTYVGAGKQNTHLHKSQCKNV